MSYQKIAKLVDLLVQNTKSNNVEWDKTELSNEFQASFADYSVRLAHIESELEDEYVIKIYDWAGDVMEEVSDVQLKELIRDPYRRMKEMYEIARRKVMGVEDALDSIISKLEDNHPF